VDVAVELVVEVVVALVLQRGATRGTLEALHVQVLILDAHENATKKKIGVEKSEIISGSCRMMWVREALHGSMMKINTMIRFIYQQKKGILSLKSSIIAMKIVSTVTS